MFVLGIETSGLVGSVALVKDKVCLTEKQLNQAGRRHAQSLVLEIGDLLRSHGMTSRDVDAVAVGHGPGSFTGLRIGMVCAKTFAYATRCRFVAIDTFAAIAENAPAEIRELVVIEDAQRDDLFEGDYSRDASNRWTLSSPIQVISRTQFLRNRTATDVVTGPGSRKLDPSEVLPHWLSSPEFCSPRASIIALLAEARIASHPDEPGSVDTDFWRASPYYVRASAAEEKRAIQR